MSFPTGGANVNNKKYGFPVSPFSKRNDNRIANFFRLRNIENDLNDFSNDIKDFINDAYTIKTITKTITFSSGTKNYTQTLTAGDLQLEGSIPICYIALNVNSDDAAVSGFVLDNVNMTGAVRVSNLRNTVAGYGVVTNVTYASGTSGELNVTKLSGAQSYVTLTIRILYRKIYAGYDEKQ